jgi:hypothetical protein
MLGHFDYLFRVGIGRVLSVVLGIISFYITGSNCWAATKFRAERTKEGPIKISNSISRCLFRNRAIASTHLKTLCYDEMLARIKPVSKGIGHTWLPGMRHNVNRVLDVA